MISFSLSFSFIYIFSLDYDKVEAAFARSFPRSAAIEWPALL